MTFTLLPAVDVANDQAVRLVQGEVGTETSYGAPIDAEAASAAANLEGAIVGKALYAGRFTLPEALEAMRHVAAAPDQP